MRFIYLLLLLLSFQSFSAQQKTLTILSWDNFFPKEVIKEFEDKYDVRVRIISYYTDEMKDFIFKDSAYNSIDVVVSSANGIMDFAQSNKIVEIESTRLYNLKHFNVNFSDSFIQSHSVPLSYGALGIVYRKDLISEKNRPKSFKELLSPNKIYQKKIFLMSDPEDIMDIFMLAHKGNLDNYSMEQLHEIAFKLKTMKPYIINYSYPEENSMDLLSSGKAYIGVAYGFEVFKTIKEHKNIGFYYAEEGAKAWTDNLAISKSSKNIDMAYTFLNFVMEPKNSAKISNHNLYATFNNDSLPYVNEDLKNNPLIYPHLNGVQLVIDKNSSSYILGKKFFFYQKIMEL